MVVEPAAAPAVTGTLTLDAFAAIKTVDGTVAAELLLELTLMVRPPAGADDPAGNKFRVIFCVALVEMNAVCGEKLRLALTCTT